jgi:hypothetical protein
MGGNAMKVQLYEHLLLDVAKSHTHLLLQNMIMEEHLLNVPLLEAIDTEELYNLPLKDSIFSQIIAVMKLVS